MCSTPTYSMEEGLMLLQAIENEWGGPAVTHWAICGILSQNNTCLT